MVRKRKRQFEALKERKLNENENQKRFSITFCHFTKPASYLLMKTSNSGCAGVQ